MRHAAVTNTGGDDGETVVFAFVFRARTEQLYVASGSISTLVDG